MSPSGRGGDTDRFGQHGPPQFQLNYENNILFYDSALTADVRQRQQDYIARSCPVDLETVAAWPMTRRLWNNTIAMLGPLL
jgi:cardiolipin synthase